ncbi:MAG: hypothetical protein A3A94_02650 [Candidatus Portnoybacteria bacterium RIFCSPLOWO2_01_FULL_43_11]|uniref:Uncharacterized protein n=4 Tax=Candidatus Portnoyibacteriota TaxID=1817913 RepID=A0A1G2FCY8_9BACT|nr:MAG: hypothetical protein A2815_00650 [Candidatus Portnoybacteria bacterium RIFCSPHIGHO2_01_FULL_40_12b]OGZ38698.1 MAG: hypothetical protein A3A94_02650 [Candidatus Portnoybacteria bacterium RIFCSPLOWO2_01_FULL_43_11]OGZ38752.1 MAG: hypothetical protein A3E90_03385 [Candidatus Portnoybacteria bacterium RIFCSPHIGHO2_12_FULL_40_11]OGZ41067.1 MAG: hypothetical protein A3I20_01330 [Candidatus Portnoybacteria bacterium RIFCSPLOWO2_02_FULL_40_15]
MNKENNNNGIDLSNYFKNSAEKSPSGQRSSGPYVSPFAPKIIQWLIKYSGGLIKNENQAAYVLSGFVVLTIIISLFLILGREGERKRGKSFTPPAEAPTEEVIPPA